MTFSNYLCIYIRGENKLTLIKRKTNYENFNNKRN